MNFNLNLPSEIVFGKGTFKSAGEKFKRLGNKTLIVCDPFMSANGIAGLLAEDLRKNGIESVIFDKVEPNPTYYIIDSAAELARSEKAEFITGLGGGSSMDTAKGVAVAATHGGKVWPYAIGEKGIDKSVLPVATITTTSGTGSQCTCFAVISNPETNQKPGMGSPYIIPEIAIIDPELMVTAPKGLSLITGFDVLAHAIEAYTSKIASPVSDMFAEKAIKTAGKYLPAVYKDGKNLEARAQMALADTCAGIAICNAAVSLAHVLAHVVSGFFPDIAHGDALASIYPEIMKFNSTALPRKNKFIAEALCPGSSSVSEAFNSFFSEFEFENRLKTKIEEDSTVIDKITDDTFTYLKFCVELNPVEVSPGHVKRILTNSLA
jgi:alcohol dehydrogenase class IV